MPLDLTQLLHKWQHRMRQTDFPAGDPTAFGDEQDWIEWSLGFDHPIDARTRRWSGLA